MGISRHAAAEVVNEWCHGAMVFSFVKMMAMINSRTGWCAWVLVFSLLLPLLLLCPLRKPPILPLALLSHLFSPPL